MTSMFESKRSVRRLVLNSIAVECMAQLLSMKFCMPRARPKLLSTWGERLLDISLSERMASSMTYIVLSIRARLSPPFSVESAESDILADESSGPRPSCSSREKSARDRSSVRSTAVMSRFSSSRRLWFMRSMYLIRTFAKSSPTEKQNEMIMPSQMNVCGGTSTLS